METSQKIKDPSQNPEAFPSFKPIRKKPNAAPFKKGDTLVLIGELFSRGYANGLVEEAQKHGLKIIRATVGRRDESQVLRAMNEAELSEIQNNTSFPNSPVINIPLEAGFDLELDHKGMRIVDYLKGFKLSEWEKAQVPADSIAAAKESARQRFRKNLTEFVEALKPHISPGSHVHFAHLMAGGVPRTKLVMPLLNRVFKGTGDRYLSSKTFWDSSIGLLLQQNFIEVTANTYNELIQVTTDLRKKQESTGGTVSYVAYGYHGTETIIDGKYQWQSYAPYVQGWAKIELENISKRWAKEGIRTCVYNCPEILTNSSSIFQGVEIPLYNLTRAFKRELPDHPLTKKIVSDCRAQLKAPENLEKIYNQIDQLVHLMVENGTSDFATWPQHSTQIQLERMIETSNTIYELQVDKNSQLQIILSELIFRSCGYIMLHEGFKPAHPVSWIGHDIVVRCLE